MKKTFKMMLCEGRHEIPDAVDGSIFGFDVDPLNPNGLEVEAVAKIKSLGIEKLDLYVTGLSVALVAVLNAAKLTGVEIALYHYDKDSETYYRQNIR